MGGVGHVIKSLNHKQLLFKCDAIKYGFYTIRTISKLTLHIVRINSIICVYRYAVYG